MTVDKRERVSSVTLEDGRRVTVGAGIDVDRGGWILHDTGLFRWLTAGDCRALGVELNASADHLEANPPWKQRRCPR